ncbi:MAG: DUF2029 domain-containing protein [Caldilineaceae bacterium]|nr:DUF2029 domain-containing protein [Caldilineaceae bacterium]HRJ41196.1 glycosyltransferase family 87 protein [Caldilineaceae bacterium]
MKPARLSPLARLGGLGLLSLLAYGWLAWRYPLGASLQWPRGGWYPPQQAILSNLWVHLAVYGLLFGAYLLALGKVSQHRSGGSAESCEPEKGTRIDTDGKDLHGGVLSLSKGFILRKSATSAKSAVLLPLVVVFVWLAASLLLLWATPSGDSHDIYDYIYRGRLQVEKGLSPLAVTPKEAPRMAFYAYTAWKENVDTYGPLWEYPSAGVSWLVNRWLGANRALPVGASDCPQSPVACRALMAWVTGYRLLGILLAGLTGWLIYGLVQRERPGWGLCALLVWLWNPAMLLSSAVGGHNDGPMLLLLLLTFWAAQRQRWVLAFLLLGLSAHVKLTSLIWAPVLGLWLWRQIGLKRALLAGLGAGVLLLPLSWLLYQPLGGWQTLPRMLGERVLYVANSPSQFVDRLLPLLGYRLPKEFVRFYIIQMPTYAYGLLGVLVPAWLLWRNRLVRQGANPQLWGLALLVAMLYLTVGSFWFQHWYVLWAVLPASLLPWSRFTRWVLPFVCLGPLAANIIADTLARLPVMIISVIGLTGLVVATIWLPGMLAGGVALWGRKRGWGDEMMG